MKTIEALLASYLDLARHLDPLRFKDGAPPAIAHRLGRFDSVSLRAQVTALRSISNALEDLEDIAARDDEVDRTMLLDTIRGDTVRLESVLDAPASNPALPLLHLGEALDELMGEDFDAASEAALRERIAALPGFLESLRDDVRPAPSLALEESRALAGRFDEAVLEMASERLDEATVQPAMVAIAEHRRWLQDGVPGGGGYAIDPDRLEALLQTLLSEPLGIKGTLRLLEFRRAGVERSLSHAAEELGRDDAIGAAQELLDDAQPAADVCDDYWDDEWQRTGDAMRALGLPIVDGDPPPIPDEAQDGWSMTAYAVRDHAIRMMRRAMQSHPDPVRRYLHTPGWFEGWGRTVAALLRQTDVFDNPERRLMMSFLALRESVTAEADLMLRAGLASPDELVPLFEETGGVDDSGARDLLGAIATEPLRVLAAALAHEAWQAWYAEEGGEPVPFIQKAMETGGLAVRLARWSHQPE